MASRRTVLIVVFTLVAAGIAAVLVVAAVVSPLRQLPSDAIVTARFRAHRAELDALVAKALPDSALAGAGQGPALLGFPVYVRDASGSIRKLLPAQVETTGRSEYAALLRRAGIASISRSRDGNLVWLTVLSNARVRKGFIYSTQPLTPVRESLDGLEGEVGSGQLAAAFVPLAPGWYLFLMGKE